jgi:hypothetical protein
VRRLGLSSNIEKVEYCINEFINLLEKTITLSFKKILARLEKNLNRNIFHIGTNMIIQRNIYDIHSDNIIKRSGSNSFSGFHVHHKKIKPQK